MRELRAAHESVVGERLLPDTFRRSMLSKLTATGEPERARQGRPEELYRKRTAVDSGARSRD